MMDRNLMLIYLKEREAFGWAMAAEANSRNMDGAKLAWDEYAMICGNLREELESEPAPTVTAEARPEVLLQACDIKENAPILNGRILSNRGKTAVFTDVEYLLVEGKSVLARYSPNRPWFEVKASDIIPMEGETK